MSIQKELERMLSEEIIPEIEDHIDDLFEKIADNKSATMDDKTDLEEMRELRDDFKEMLTDLQNGDMDDDECQEIMQELNDMRRDEA